MSDDFANDYLQGTIDKAEFNRRNALQLIKSDGHKIMAQDTAEYLESLLTAAAPPPPLEKLIREYEADILKNREAIAKAFLAEYGFKPDEMEQVFYPTKDGGTGWRLRRIDPNNGVPIPIEIVETLMESARALVGADACPDPDCGSDQCVAYQMIVQLLPKAAIASGPSHAAMQAANGKDAPAARPSLSLQGAANILDSLIESPRYEIPENVREHLRQFRDRWFNFHEQHLTEIEAALPAPVDEMGGTLPAAVANMAARYTEANRSAEEYRHTLASQAEARDARFASYLEGGTYGHVGDISQIISDLDLHQEQIEKNVAKWADQISDPIKEELRFWAEMIRGACANLEPLRNLTQADGSVVVGSADLMAKINAIVQEWYASGVGLAIATAPAKLHKIGEMLNARAAVLLAESRAQDKAERRPESLDILGNREALDALAKLWAPVINLCHENAELLGIGWGGSVSEKVLEILQEWISIKKAAKETKNDQVDVIAQALHLADNTENKPEKCATCGYIEDEHWMGCPTFKGKEK
jgi:hypothetical protein